MEPFFLFAPGAGAPSSHPWMRRWADLLGEIGRVQTLDYPYMLAGSRRPDPLVRLIAAHREALRSARANFAGPVYLVGKSMGSRVGCHVSLEEEVAGVVCFGYPLCGGGDPEKLRDKVLRELVCPALLIQGTRDKLCPLELLKEVRSQMKAPNELYIVEGGDHSLGITKTQLQERGLTQQQIEQQILEVIRRFVLTTSQAAGLA